MRVRVWLMAAVVGLGGSVLAQDRDVARTPERSERAVERHRVEDAAARREGGGVVDATRSGVQRAWDATRSAAHRGAEALRRTGKAIERRLPGTHEEAAEADRGATRTMGGAPADRGDERSSRMDEAYGNWKRQQESR
ncbi:hypothetical protein JI739_10300 [Ramlibacter sp. AW1]|uniref:Uncharacterized protein n=1 Tax=Ramlibacter aurantiacus TaxID=2801330 RepID=A0A936ZT91_9BURK|nr:hypothetical protein [Ramlibacter aurantiacus]MBL0420735.1 hypothetical protein [Ramlibacter aurantiacus]